jgi:hypothetical protein
MAIPYGILRDPTGSYRILRVSYGILRDPTGSYGCPYESVGSYGILRDSGCPYESVGPYGILRGPTGVPMSQWDPTGSYETPGVPMSQWDPTGAPMSQWASQCDWCPYGVSGCYDEEFINVCHFPMQP